MQIDREARQPWYRKSSARSVFWVTGAALTMAAAEMFKAFVSQEAQHHSMPFHALVEQNVPWWLTWAAFSPVIFWLAERFRLDDKDRFLARLPIHFVAALILASAHLTISGLMYFASDFSYIPEAARKFLPQTRTELISRWHQSFLIMDMLTYGVILGLHYVIEYQRRLRHEALVSAQLRAQTAQLQHSMVEARLQALRMELNPHFLFNALNSISALVRKNENRAAISMIAGLGDLLRATLERGSDAEMPLGDELRLVDLYLNIARIRFADRMKTIVEVPAELRHAMVPTLALQPLVENAVRHGIGETDRVVTIAIRAKQDVDTLIVQVSDDGPGLRETDGDKRPQGIGLSNTRSRLDQLYGASAKLTVANAPTGGAVATMTLPLRMNGKENLPHA